MSERKLKILVIDDEVTARTKMKAILSGYGECGTAKNGNEALDRVRAAIKGGAYFDLITIDIQLPDYDGIDLLGDIVELEEQNKVRATKIMVSASGTASNVGRAAMNHCDGFLVKPVKKIVLHKKTSCNGPGVE